MEYEEFKSHYSFMYSAHVAVAANYLFSKSEKWLQENIPIIEYPEEIYKHIVTTTACIDLVGNIQVYEVSGQWLRIAIKNNQ